MQRLANLALAVLVTTAAAVWTIDLAAGVADREIIPALVPASPGAPAP